MGQFKSFMNKQEESSILTEGASQSLSRVLSHIKSAEGFGIVTPFRKSAGAKKNFELLKKAENIARSAGFGFFKIRGYWYEDNKKTEERTLAEEISLFIPNDKGKNLLDVLIEIAHLSNPPKSQDGFIYAHNGELELWLLNEDESRYSPVQTFTKIHVSNVEEMLKKIKQKQLTAGSALRDRKKESPPSTSGFFFESFWIQPESSVGAMGFAKAGYIF